MSDETPTRLCGALMSTKVFHHYPYGDPLPAYARYVGEDSPVEKRDAITVYVRCEREAGHPGKHLARGTTGWTD